MRAVDQHAARLADGLRAEARAAAVGVADIERDAGDRDRGALAPPGPEKTGRNRKGGNFACHRAQPLRDPGAAQLQRMTRHYVRPRGATARRTPARGADRVHDTAAPRSVASRPVETSSGPEPMRAFWVTIMAGFLAAAPAPAQQKDDAAGYPSRTVKIIVSAPPG